MISDTRIGETTEAGAAATHFLRWKHRRRNPVGGAAAPVSSRKLAASLWRTWRLADRLGFQFCSSMPIPRFATEGATKWDCADYFHSNVKPASAGHSALFKSRNHVINRLAEGVKSERKFCKKMDRINSNLLLDIAEAKISARKLCQNLEKEKKAREELEEMCHDLAKEIEGRRAEIVALKNEQRRVHEEVEEERRMRQMAEVWREEQAQMKLADARIVLEDKYEEVNEVISHVRALMRRSNVDSQAEWRSDGRCCSDDQADCASFVHFITNEFRDAGRKNMSWIGESEGSVRKRKMQPNNKAPSSTNPHVARAMTGRNQWPWRIRSRGQGGNILETKLESQRMLLRNLLKQKM